MVQEYDLVTARYSAEPVSNQNDGFLVMERIDGFHHSPLCDGIKRTGGLIKYEDIGVVV